MKKQYNTAKGRQINEGLRRLEESRLPGQCFSQAELARACNVHRRTIGFIETSALHSIAVALAAEEGLVEELFHGRSVKEVLSKTFANPYKTGRPAVRPKKAPARKADKFAYDPIEVS